MSRSTRLTSYSQRQMRDSIAFLFHVVLLWLLGLGAAQVRAQEDPLQAIGIQPFSGQIPVPNGNVNVSNGNVHLEFPLVSLPQRGTKRLEIKIVYDSNIWYQQPSPVAWVYRIGRAGGNVVGWNIYSNLGAATDDSSMTPRNICHIDGSEAYDSFNHITWTGPDGITHPFDSLSYAIGFQNACGNYTSMTTVAADAVADDGSGYHASVVNGNISFYANDGSLPDDGGYFDWKDSNGNYFYCDWCWQGNNDTESKDTLGRDPLIISTSGATNTMKILTAGKNSGVGSYVVTYESVNYDTNFGAGAYEVSGSFQVIKSIQLPDGTSYSFTYDSGTTSGHYGDLLSMTLPTGSTIYFTYANFFDAEIAMSGWTHHETRMLSTMTTPDGTDLPPISARIIIRHPVS